MTSMAIIYCYRCIRCGTLTKATHAGCPRCGGVLVLGWWGVDRLGESVV